MEEQKTFQRYVAVKILIKDILHGEYVQEEEDKPNYLRSEEGKIIYRVNVVAAIVSKEIVGTITSFLLDDSTEKIVLRLFENNKTINTLNVGDIILTIGRVRVYNQEKYISPEIIKRVAPEWLKVRAAEFNQSTKSVKTLVKATPLAPELVEEEVQVLETKVSETLPAEKIMKMIQQMDTGNGVPIEDLVEKSSLENTEKILIQMIENGDIYQNLPGRVKVL